jgi:hypothetical protein
MSAPVGIPLEIKNLSQADDTILESLMSDDDVPCWAGAKLKADPFLE